MEKQLPLLITKQHYHKGFGILDVLLTLMIVGIISVMSLPLLSLKPLSKNHAILLAQYQIDQTQLHAIAFAKRSDLPFTVDNTKIYYNAQGNVNQAKGGRLSYPYPLLVTFYLGYGRYEFR